MKIIIKIIRVILYIYLFLLFYQYFKLIIYKFTNSLQILLTLEKK